MDVIPEEPTVGLSNLQQMTTTKAPVGSNGSIATLGGSAGSLSSSTGSLSRSGIKMGSVALNSPPIRLMVKPPVVSAPRPLERPPMFRPLDPARLLGAKPSNSTTLNMQQFQQVEPIYQQRKQNDPSTNDQSVEDKESQQSEESDWEQEVTEQGNVVHVVPYSHDESTGVQQKTWESNPFNSDPASRDESGKRSGKLSRLVRRRESKRDRNVHKGRPKVALKPPSDAFVGKTASARRTNSYESSDNESSTYGQIKTFEAFFEASNLDDTVAASAAVVGMNEGADGDSSESSRDATEIHEVALKFSTKPLKAQIPHFQMLLHGDNPANRGLLLEALLGIIPEAKPMPSEAHNGDIVDNSVVVGGLVPEGVADKAGKVRIGDIIRSLDGHHVNIDSANTYLLHKLSKTSSSSSSGKVKLILQRPVGPALRTRSKNQLRNVSEVDRVEEELNVVPNTIIVGRVDGFNSAADFKLLHASPVIAMLLTQQGITDSSPDMADIMYQFPLATPSEPPSPYVRVRGVFSTLSQLLQDIVSSPPITSTLLMTARTGSEEELVHVSYAQNEDETFIIGLPASKMSASQSGQFLRETHRFLCLRYGSIGRAVMAAQREIDNLLANLFLDIVRSSAPHSPFEKSINVHHVNPINEFEATLEACQWLNLPDEIRFQVEDAMNQFESSDFQDYSDDFYDLPREFVICGSCIFHRGYIVASHLQKEDLVDLRLWLKYERVLSITRQQPVHQVVIWHELHQTPRLTIDAAETGRRFLLVTGLGYQLLGVILETGGCTARPSGVVRPDPFYVDQAANTLEHLVDMGIPLVCEKWLTLPPNPSLINIDDVYTMAAKAKRLDLSTGSTLVSSTPSTAVVLRRTKSLELSSSSTGSTASEGGGGEGFANIDGTSETSYEMSTAFRGDKDIADESSQWEVHKSGQRSHIHFSSVEPKPLKGSVRSNGSGAQSTATTSSVRSEDDASASDFVTYQVSQLTMGTYNTLLHYLHLDVGEGVFLAPVSTGQGKLHNAMLANFQSAAQLVHGTLQRCSTQRAILRAANADSCCGQEWLNSNLVAVREQGMLFRWSPVEGLPVLSYWVCGRLFLTPDPKECYVAYHESAPQQMVELAFRLAFGLQP